MSTNFLSLPRELRDQIYELVLVQQESISPWFDRFGQLTPGLFRVNKAISYEATSLFYSQNRFDLTGKGVEHIARFLGQIGRNNGNYIRHICIGFPQFVTDPGSGDLTLGDDTVSIFSKIQSGCTNLRTLMISHEYIYSEDFIWLPVNEIENFETVNEALKLVDTRLTAIPSLQEIIVEMYEESANNDMRREMESHGWKISIIEVKDEDIFCADVWDSWG